MLHDITCGGTVRTVHIYGMLQYTVTVYKIYYLKKSFFFALLFYAKRLRYYYLRTVLQTTCTVYCTV